jgi:hypothetical protein
MQLRIFAVAFIALLFALGQTYGSAASLLGSASAYASSTDRAGSTVLADDNDNADEANADNDEASSDNDNDTADTDNSDDDDVAMDNVDDDNDNGATATTGTSTGTSAGGPIAPIDSAALMLPLTEVSGTSNGGDMRIATPGDRVAIQMFPWMPAGVQVTIRPVDPNTVMAAPGQRAGDLEFVVEARDANGVQLTSLPAEVNLAVRYADQTVDGLNESNLTLSRLDPFTNQWQEAPKIVRETDSNYVAASITQLGTYVVSAR